MLLMFNLKNVFKTAGQRWWWWWFGTR